MTSSATAAIHLARRPARALAASCWPVRQSRSPSPAICARSWLRSCRKNVALLCTRTAAAQRGGTGPCLAFLAHAPRLRVVRLGRTRSSLRLHPAAPRSPRSARQPAHTTCARRSVLPPRRSTPPRPRRPRSRSSPSPSTEPSVLGPACLPSSSTKSSAMSSRLSSATRTQADGWTRPSGSSRRSPTASIRCVSTQLPLERVRLRSYQS